MNAPVIRCMSCNTPIGDKWAPFYAALASLPQRDAYLTAGQTKSPVGKLLDDLGITRPCCRKHFLVQI